MQIFEHHNDLNCQDLTLLTNIALFEHISKSLHYFFSIEYWLNDESLMRFDELGNEVSMFGWSIEIRDSHESIVDEDLVEWGE